MDAHPPLAMTDDEIEISLLEAAVEEALRDPRPSIPNEVIQAKLVKKMAELQMRIAALVNK